MDLTIIIGHLWQGGGERVCVNLANQMAEEGYSVRLIVSSLEGAHYVRELNPSVLLEEVKSTALLSIFLYYLKRVPAGTKVISFNYNLSVVVSILKILKNIYLVSRSINTLTEEIKNDSYLKKGIKKLTIVWSLNYSDKVISQSVGMKKDLISNGVKPNVIDVINNPVSSRFKYNGRKRENYILFAGRLVAQKNLFGLIDILSSVNTEIHLYLAGDGPLREELIEYARKKNVLDRVELLGVVDSMETYYASAVCTVLTSHYEGFPNVLIESIACGTPVVSFDCPNGPSEIIIDGVNGYLVDHYNTALFAQRVNDLYSFQIDPIQVSGTATRFRSEYIVDKYLKVLNLR